jgi:GrpB-like predicted nucleotidyltransferase (UPF0157 family)
MRAITSRMSNGRRVSFGTMPYSSSAGYSGSRGSAGGDRQHLAAVEAGDDVARDLQRVAVVLGEMVGHARHRGVHVGAAQRLGIDHLAGRRLHQRRAAEEDRALFLDDDRLVAHRRHVGAAGGAAAHHHRDLRDVLRAHPRLVVEDPAEVLLVGEHLVLQRQEGAAGVDQVDARQPVLARDLLRAQVLLDRHREVGAALDRGVVGHHHHFLAQHPADAADHPGRGRGAVVHVLGGERRDLQERRARVEQGGDAVARQQLAALDVLLARLLAAALGRACQAPVEFVDQRAVVVRVVAEFAGARIQLRGDRPTGGGTACGRNVPGRS